MDKYIVYKDFGPDLKDSEIDIIYALVDNLCKSGNWNGLDEVFQENPKFIRIDFILSLLVSTNPVKNRLVFRGEFLEKCIEIHGAELFEGLK